jgi:hypothetical protein
MEFILLLIILFVCLCSKVNTDVAVSQSKKKATEKIEKSNNWRDRTFDSFIVPEITEYIVAEENAEEIAELIEELSKAAPELRQHPIILYNYQMNSTFTQKEKDMVIYSNARFLVPFVMAKKGKTNDYFGVTFPQQMIINEGTAWKFKRSNEAPWGFSQKSLINLNKWLEKTMRANGVHDARIVYCNNYTGNEFCWEAAALKKGERLW